MDMSNTYCHDGYCGPAPEEERHSEQIEFFDSWIAIAAVAVIALVLLGVAIYGSSQGLYIDPAMLIM